MKEGSRFYTPERQLNDHCGLVAVLVRSDSRSRADVLVRMAQEVVHRGQEGLGVVGVSGGEFVSRHHELGGNWDCLPAEVMTDLGKCSLLIAHNLSPVEGRESGGKALQPFVGGELFLAHNGALLDPSGLRREIEQTGLSCKVDSDGYFLLNRIRISEGLGGDPQSETNDKVGGRLIEACWRSGGAFSLLLGTTEGVLYAGRDPLGMRPLAYGELDGDWAVASETNALKAVGAKKIKPVLPGHFLRFDQNGVIDLGGIPSVVGEGHCIFELVYTSRPESDCWVGGEWINVGDSRKYAGAIHARNDWKRGWSAENTAVVPINRSGRYLAMGYAEESGFPLVDALPRNPEVGQGRIFIQSTTEERRAMAVRKHMVRPELLKGKKRVILTDDSIVRGETTEVVVTRLRQELPGIEVHLRIGSPPVIRGCGIAANTSFNQLLAPQYGSDSVKIAEAIGADSVVYLTLEELLEAAILRREDLPRNGFCTSCFSGRLIFPGLKEER